MNTSENETNGHCGAHICDLCWERFTTAEGLASHVEQEDETLFSMGAGKA